MAQEELPGKLDKRLAEHDEYADNHALALLSAEVKYDNGKLRDLGRDPYVFGAALLASLGGFSFGYGQYAVPVFSGHPSIHVS